MVNKLMQQESIPQPIEPRPQTVPNESGQLHLDDFVRIIDPNTMEVLLEKRS